jgi:hypothetical protein
LVAESKPPLKALREFVVSGVTPAAAAERSLFEEAGRQGLLALLAAAPGFLSGLREDRREEWRAAARRLLVRGLRQLALARRVRDTLASASLRALPLKGAAVAERLYASAAERPMADVDLLVLDDPARAVRLLEAEGFKVVERAEHAVALREDGSGAVVELHRSLTSCPGLFPLDREGLWARREAVSVGIVAEAPSPADLLVSLSLHAAFQHGFGLSLVQYLDFRRLLERARPERDRVLEAAEKARAEGAVLLALAAARAVVGAEPEGLRPALEARLGDALRRRARALESGDPLRLLAPSRPSLAAARFALAAGRRVELIRRTLWPEAWPDEPRPRPGRALAVGLRRAGRLARREATGWP